MQAYGRIDCQEPQGGKSVRHYTEYQDLSCVHINRLPNRTTLVPYPDRDSAMAGDREFSLHEWFNQRRTVR
jgi:hypothetical protein